MFWGACISWAVLRPLLGRVYTSGPFCGAPLNGRRMHHTLYFSPTKPHLCGHGIITLVVVRTQAVRQHSFALFTFDTVLHGCLFCSFKIVRVSRYTAVGWRNGNRPETTPRTTPRNWKDACSPGRVISNNSRLSGPKEVRWTALPVPQKTWNLDQIFCCHV